VKASPDGRHCASSSSDKTVKVWNLDTHECVHTFTNVACAVWDVAYSPSGTELIAAGDDGTLHHFSVEV
jgi:WD repeat-containing protein 61